MSSGDEATIVNVTKKKSIMKKGKQAPIIIKKGQTKEAAKRKGNYPDGIPKPDRFERTLMISSAATLSNLLKARSRYENEM